MTPIEAHTVARKTGKGSPVAEGAIMGVPGSDEVRVLPDFDGDDWVGVDDINDLRQMWQTRKDQVDATFRDLLFDPTEGDTARVGARQLFRILSAWQLRGDAPK